MSQCTCAAHLLKIVINDLRLRLTTPSTSSTKDKLKIDCETFANSLITHSIETRERKKETRNEKLRILNSITYQKRFLFRERRECNRWSVAVLRTFDATFAARPVHFIQMVSFLLWSVSVWWLPLARTGPRVQKYV